MRSHPVTVNVTAADPDGNPITSLVADLSGLPAGNNAVFTVGAGNTSGTLTWTPTPADIRPTPYTVTFTAANALSGSAATAITVTDSAVVVNLVANPGFETDLSGWGSYGSAALTRVAGGHSGGFCVRAAGSSTSSFGIDDVPNTVPTVAAVGDVYRFSCWIRSDNTTRAVKIRVYELAGGSQVGSTFYSPEVTLAPTWKFVTVDYTTRQAGTALSMRITDYPSTSGEVFFIDDVSIEKLSGPALVASAGDESHAHLAGAAAPVTSSPRAFPTDGNRAPGLEAGEGLWTLQIEGLDGPEFEGAVPRIVLTRGDRTATAAPDRVRMGEDTDANGFEEVAAGFPVEDLRRLLETENGDRPVEIAVEVNPGTPGAIRVPLALESIRRPGVFSASFTPNPMRDRGTLLFTLTRSGPVTARIFDAQGREIRTLIDDPNAKAGSYSLHLDGHDGRTGRMPAGVYFYRIDATEGVRRGRLVLVK
jgi:hypothetical protein